MSLVSSLTNRIFLSTALLVALAIGVAVELVNRAATSQAEQDLGNGLRESAALVNDFVHERSTRFVSEARLIVVLPLLTNALATGDPPTVQSVARDYADLLAPDLFIVTDRSDRVLARVGRISPTVVRSEDIGIARAPGDGAWFAPYAGGILQMAAIPIRSGSLPLGTLVLGFSLDQTAVDGIKARTNSDIALLAGSRVLAGTLGEDSMAGLSAFARQAGTFHVSLNGDDYLGLVQPLDPADAGRHGPVAIVLRSRTARLRFLGQLQRNIALAGFAAVLMATLIGYGIARTVTRPLRDVTETMRTMAATGNLAEATPAPRPWDDEDARLLATTFTQLTTALDRFQREAAQRERLSSLGRLSTVIAHEVRNPLMIIKSAARTLRRDTSPQVIGVAENIDEEVRRLNRVVSDVLDFARPIRFEMAPAAVAEICRDAAQAARATPDLPPIALEIAGSADAVVTDAERLRGVLVNLLANAQQAVAARAGDDSPAPVRLVAEHADGRWRIDVIDRGVGIAPEDLPRVFEPFFTTRRTGSGLGLALARNVIEGLGGTITIESAVNVGTKVRLDLPGHTGVQRVPA